MHVEADHVTGPALKESGVRAQLHRLVNVATRKSKLLQAFHLATGGGLVDVDERCSGRHRPGRLLECPQDDLVDLALPRVEAAADRKGARDVARITFGRGRSRIVDDQLPGFHQVAVGVVVEHLAAHRQNDRKRHR